MTRPINRDRQIKFADFAFGLMAAFGVLGLIADSFDVTPTIPNAPNPWLTGLGAIALMIIVGMIITRVAAIDRKRSEEYTFGLLASGAVVAVMTTLLVTFAWTSDFLLARWLGEPTSSQILALMMGSWSIGYFTYRFKGTSE